MRTSPTITTRPRSRASDAASSAGSLDSVAAQTSTASAESSQREPRSRSERTCASAPADRASSTSSELRSTPRTRQPAALAIRTASWPMSPSPITATVDPTWTSARRQPFNAIAPRVAKAASSAETSSGTFAQSRAGTTSRSEWFANPPPAIETRSPGESPLTSPPASTTTPAALYPRGPSSSSLWRTRLTVERTPSRRIRSTTCRVWSGRARAFAIRLLRARPSVARSVPALRTEAFTLTAASPGPGLGSGTSTRSRLPSLSRRAICRIRRFLRWTVQPRDKL